MDSRILRLVEQLLKEQSFSTLNEIEKELDNNQSGFYWIFTKKTIQDFQKCTISKDIKHIDLKKLSKLHVNLKYVIEQNDTDLWCIYNGKGIKLKQRIIQEFNQGKGTGTLALKRDFKIEDFKIKYIICGNTNISKKHISEDYEILKKDLERVWRLNNKHSIFCRI